MTSGPSASDEAPRPRVVITGAGAVCALGPTPAAIWDAMAEGRSAFGPITRFDASRFATRIAAEVADADRRDPRFEEAYWDRLDARSRFAVRSTLDAVRHAGLSLTPQNRAQVAVVLASERPPDEALAAGAERLAAGDVDGAAAALASTARPWAPAERVAALLGSTGPVLQLGHGTAGGLDAVIEAAAIIRRGDALVAIAGGAEAPITPLTLAAYQGAGLLSRRNADPAAAARPLDRDRDGMVLAEGAAIVVLELLEVAVARGARILAEIEGEGLRFSPGRSGEPALDAAPIGQALQQALAVSGRIQSEVDVIALDAAGTVDGDRIEALGVRRVFGAAARHHVYTPALKSHTGHALGASGPLTLVLMLEALERQRIPATRNLDHEGEEIELDGNARGIREDSVRVVGINAIGASHAAFVLLTHPRAMRRIPEFVESATLPLPDANADLP
ncbi:MAG: beta-ketoacyl-[acyl-carrier-protein] synthase family protein [Dehalococcoidia bacterium]